MAEVCKEIELEGLNVLLQIPKDAIALTISAKLLIDGEVRIVSKDLSVSDIHDARRNFLEYVEGGDDYGAKYILTDKGKEWLDSLKDEEDDEE